MHVHCGGMHVHCGVSMNKRCHGSAYRVSYRILSWGREQDDSRMIEAHSRTLKCACLLVGAGGLPPPHPNFEFRSSQIATQSQSGTDNILMTHTYVLVALHQCTHADKQRLPPALDSTVCEQPDMFVMPSPYFHVC